MSDRLIGRGTYAKVYERKVAGRSVAVKALPYKRFTCIIREIMCCNACLHPNVIAIEDVHYMSDAAHIIMPMYSTDLHKYIKRSGPISVAVAERILGDILAGLRHIHEQGIIHGDIKPHNILLRIDNTCIQDIVICDFGIAVSANEVAHSTAVQTCDYRAPEININSKTLKYTTAIDLWSVGCIAFELLAGKQLIEWRSGVEDTTIYMCEIYGFETARTRIARRTAMRAATTHFIVNTLGARIAMATQVTAPYSSQMTSILLLIGGLLQVLPAHRPTAELAHRMLYSTAYHKHNTENTTGEHKDLYITIDATYDDFVHSLPSDISGICTAECLKLAWKVYKTASILPMYRHHSTVDQDRNGATADTSQSADTLLMRACVFIACSIHYGNRAAVRALVTSAPIDVVILAKKILSESRGILT